MKEADNLKVLLHSIEEYPGDWFLGLEEESKEVTLAALKVK
jgi:hypothetical protein